jgi:formamidopyrimidine-DNA glycosylase
MLELPESAAFSGQLRALSAGRIIETAMAGASPHGFAWYEGDPAEYARTLPGRVLGKACPAGGMIEVPLSGDWVLTFNDGVNLRWWQPGEKPPTKHQLLLTFTDGSALTATVQMYGGMIATTTDHMNENSYYAGSKRKPSPLGDDFTPAYFEGLLTATSPKLSAKAFLATEQRVPGLGNGVLQDILFLAGIHPARRLNTLDDNRIETLYRQTVDTLRQMAAAGGRDTEKDLHGQPGGYRTLLSRKTLAYPCPKCGGALTRKAYLGGNVYFCAACQPLQ